MLPIDLTIKVEHILAGLTIIIGGLVVFVAHSQYVLAMERFKLDLFEKRFAVYKGVQSFLTHIMADAKVTIEIIFQFRAKTQDSVFLFDDEITKYLKSIDEKALKLLEISEELKDLPIGEQRSKFAKENTELLRWLGKQLPRLNDFFSPYLKFKTWRLAKQ
jgi:hypothetical protein